MNALRAFEATARSGSMLLAASELNVTQSAVSKQIRHLEDWFGDPLFERLHREVRLTEKGRSYFEAVTRLFGELDAATQAALGRREKIRIRFLGYHTFNMRWLIPRLAGFRALHPNLEVDISAGIGDVDFGRNEVDCAIRSGTGDWPGCVSTFVSPIEFRPVARPLRPGDPPLDSIADLKQHVLVVSSTRADMWSRWLGMTGSEGLEPAGVLTFDHGSYCYQAAIEGVGVALAETLFVRKDIAAGRLFYPFAHRYLDAASYHFVRPSGPPRPGVEEFEAWLVGEAGRDPEGRTLEPSKIAA